MAHGGRTMTLDDAVSCWQSQGQSEPVMSDDAILALVRRKSELFDAKIRKRDLREIAAMIVVIVLIAPAILRPSWLTRVGVLIIICGCGIIYWKLRRARRGTPVSAAMPLVELLHAERAKRDAQISLLSTVLWWYIAPIAMGAIMIVVGGSGATWFTLGYAIFVVAISLAIYVLNRRMVSRYLRPGRDELSTLLQQAIE
jgi:Flp pilus assembly protein TadB